MKAAVVAVSIALVVFTALGGPRKAWKAWHRHACASCPVVHRDASAPLEPWEPAAEAFAGCEKSCGARASSAEPGVIVQTTSPAHVGDRVYCPVSGVVFNVNEGSAHRDVGGRTIYFCCESCAAYFDAHRAEILAARSSSAHI